MKAYKIISLSERDCFRFDEWLIGEVIPAEVVHFWKDEGFPDEKWAHTETFSLKGHGVAFFEVELEEVEIEEKEDERVPSV